MGDDSDGVDGVDIDSGVLDPEDSLDDRGLRDALDEGYSPPERPWELDEYGLTAREAADHESLSKRLRRELPETTGDDGDGLGDTTDTDGELYDDEVGSARSGRLVDVAPAGGADDGADDGVDDGADDGVEDGADDGAYLYAVDIGRDGGAASAEEAAVHVVPDELDRGPE